ncbi:thiamine phosphate synthase, partial [Caulobacter sp. 17J65-9]|uniref:thiamine phosphate synthase n=1 Tax=Caulobacter sp. 17J65-9 TaxID=2709382 RepID=UPI0013CD3644
AGIARTRGLTLLIGADAALAEACGAHGVHLPERALAEAPGLRTAHPEWLITGAAHGADALRAAEAAGLDAVLLSPVFPTRSASGHAPLGLERFAELTASTRLPVYALGGVDAGTAPALIGTGAAGVAAVEGVLK